MVYVPAERTHFRLDPTLKPIAAIAPGTEVLIDTLDNQAGRICSESDFGSSGIDDVNPVTGPIGILTVVPGDVVRLEILDVNVAERGHVQILEGYGLLAGQVEAPKTKIVTISDEKIHFDERIILPLRPMVGTIGIAPKNGASSLEAGVHGGNMDNKDIAAGSTLYVKAQVPLGLVFVGDIHAIMGDGELGLCGVEVAGSIRLRVGVERGLSIRNPMVETPSHWGVVVYDHDIERAIETAGEDMAHFLAHSLDLTLSEAVMLTGVTCDLRICQAAPRRASGASVRVVVEKAILSACIER